MLRFFDWFGFLVGAFGLIVASKEFYPQSWNVDELFQLAISIGGWVLALMVVAIEVRARNRRLRKLEGKLASVKEDLKREKLDAQNLSVDKAYFKGELTRASTSLEYVTRVIAEPPSAMPRRSRSGEE